jgi:hypothetical protein
MRVSFDRQNSNGDAFIWRRNLIHLITRRGNRTRVRLAFWFRPFWKKEKTLHTGSQW